MKYLVIIAFICIGYFAYRYHTKVELVAPVTIKTPEVVQPSEVELLFKEVKSWPLEQQVGILLIAGWNGTKPNDHIKKLISTHHISGVNLLKRNVGTKDEVMAMNAELQELTSITKLPPLLIAVDQEGGDVNRFWFLKTLTAQRNIKDTNTAYKIAKTRGEELKELGITMNFAPVVDYVTDPSAYLYSRTFATNTIATIELANSMIKGYLDAGIIPVLKHFPGYGNGKPDPHTAAYNITIKPEQLGTYLKPFKEILNTNNIPVMTAHTIFTGIETKPGTLSSYFLTNILRNDWKYKGVVISDDLEMSAVGMKPPQAAVQAINAGTDLLISTYDEQTHLDILKELEIAVANKTISESRFNEALIRVLTLRLSI